MVEITIQYRGDEIVSYTVKGHAGYGPNGTDIYCAGVSAIAQTALLGLLKHLPQPPGYEIRDGFMECVIPVSLEKPEREKAQVILTSMEAGLLAMEEEYPGCIKVNVRR